MIFLLVSNFGVKGVNDIYKMETFNIYESEKNGNQLEMKQELFGSKTEKIGNL